MKKKCISIFLLLSLAIGALTMLTGCGPTGGSGSSDWKKEAGKQGYVKKDGKWYYQGKGAY